MLDPNDDLELNNMLAYVEEGQKCHKEEIMPPKESEKVKKFPKRVCTPDELLSDLEDIEGAVDFLADIPVRLENMRHAIGSLRDALEHQDKLQERIDELEEQVDDLKQGDKDEIWALENRITTLEEEKSQMADLSDLLQRVLGIPELEMTLVWTSPDPETAMRRLLDRYHICKD